MMNAKMNYTSVSHCTRNENGVEEITIERELTIFEWFQAIITTMSFKVPAVVVEEYEAYGTQWVEKSTGFVPNDEKQHELFCIKGALKCDMRWDSGDIES
jgi:hypothetical protein